MGDPPPEEEPLEMDITAGLEQDTTSFIDLVLFSAIVLASSSEGKETEEGEEGEYGSEESLIYPGLLGLALSEVSDMLTERKKEESSEKKGKVQEDRPVHAGKSFTS